MTKIFPRTYNYKASLWMRSIDALILNRETNILKGVILWGKTQISTGLTTLFKKAEAVHATPQDLSTVLRRAGGMCIFAGPATLD